MTLKRKKISIRECLADPKERRQMLCGAVRFIQAVEGRDISMEQAEEAYDKISGSKQPHNETTSQGDASRAARNRRAR